MCTFDSDPEKLEPQVKTTPSLLDKLHLQGQDLVGAKQFSEPHQLVITQLATHGLTLPLGAHSDGQLHVKRISPNDQR